MDDLKNPLLPPQRPNPITRIYNSIPQVVVNATRSKPVPKKSSLRPWIKVEAATGESSCVSLDKLTVMRLCDLPARDLRLLDPLFVYPSTILGREKAIVVNLEKIRCIIMCDEVLISVNEWDFVGELQRRIGAKADDLPFEFVALEIALEATCSYLDAQAGELEVEAYPLLDELTSKISTLNLERARRLKSKLVALTRRVQKVRDEIEQLMDDDGDMAELYLTEKKETNENFYALHGLNYTGTETSFSAPTTPVGSTPRAALKKLEKTFSSGKSFSRHDSSVRSVEDERKNIEQLEMLLEAYFVDIDNTHNKLMSLKEYIDDTEDFINIMLDNVRNQLIQFELVLTTATFVVAMFGVVAGIFGMNFPIALFDVPNAFNWVLLVSASVGIFIFFGFLWYFKHRRLIPV